MPETFYETIDQILEAIGRIERRFSTIKTGDDFLKNDYSLTLLDSIAMMIIAIGESLKNLEKLGGKPFMDRHKEVNWQGAKGARDILSHHYFQIDAETVFDICQNDIPKLKSAIESIRAEILKPR